jgi:hypothetical protein
MHALAYPNNDVSPMANHGILLLPKICEKHETGMLYSLQVNICGGTHKKPF